MTMTTDAVIITAKGLEELKEELENLKTVRRKEVADRLKEAISYGDLSENSEYQEAKEEQAFVEGKIVDLEIKLKNARVISTKGGGVIRIGSKIELKEKGSKTTEIYSMVGTMEANPMENKISNESPLGMALLGKKKGEKALVQAPAGDFEYEIVGVK